MASKARTVRSRIALSMANRAGYHGQRPEDPTGEEPRMPVAIPVPVVLVGMHGHGRWHLSNLVRLRRAGVPVRLAGICDTRPPTGDVPELPGDVPVRARLEDLLDAVRPAVTIVCTPIHTHADLALTAAAGGSH